MFTQAVDSWVKTESSSISVIRFNSFLKYKAVSAIPAGLNYETRDSC
jgi:hypothetical protein